MMSKFWPRAQRSWWLQSVLLPSSSLHSTLARSIPHCGTPGGNMRKKLDDLTSDLLTQPSCCASWSFDGLSVELAKVSLVKEKIGQIQHYDKIKMSAWCARLPWAHSVDPDLRTSTDDNGSYSYLPPTTTVYWSWVMASWRMPAEWPLLPCNRSGPLVHLPFLAL